jgi:hypothetical protein
VFVATVRILPSTVSTSPLTVGLAAAAGDAAGLAPAAGDAAAAGDAGAAAGEAAAAAGDDAAAAGDAGAAGFGASVGFVSAGLLSAGLAVGAGGAPPQAASTSVVEATSARSARRMAGLSMGSSYSGVTSGRHGVAADA